MPQTPTEAVERHEGLEDDALLTCLRAGDEQAFERLVRKEMPRLLAVARRILRSDEDARDAVQEAFISAFKALACFEGGCRLSTWLHRIAVNASLMKLRSRQRRPEQPIDPLLPTFLEDGHHTADPQEWRDDALSLMQRREERQRVRACIDKLPESYRTVLILRDIEEMDGSEAARALGVSENLVKVRLHRARQALRELLEPHFRRGPESTPGRRRENARRL